MAKSNPAKMFREPKGHSYCQTKYIKKIPQKRLVRTTIGNNTLVLDALPRYEFTIDRAMQITDSCLEAVRRKIVIYLTKGVGKENFYGQFTSVPHIILRHNKMASGAGADRLSSGMRHAFGKAVGKAIRKKKGDTIFYVHAPTRKEHVIRSVIKRINSKMSCSIILKIIPPKEKNV